MISYPSNNLHAKKSLTDVGARNTAWLLHLLLPLLICAVPTSLLLSQGSFSTAGLYFWGNFLLSLGYFFCCRKWNQAVCLIIGAMPFINLLRDFAFYNVVSVLYGAGVVLYSIGSPERSRELSAQCSFLKPLYLFAIIYNLLSAINSGEYSENLRLFELIFAAHFVLLLGFDRSLLGVTLLGIILSTIAIGISMIPFLSTVDGERLGMATVNGQRVGNPVQLGTALALGLLALIVDRAYWSSLQKHRLLKFCLIVSLSLLLVLTTSRAGWFVVLAAIGTCFVFGKAQRVSMIWFFTVCGVAMVILINSPMGEGFQKGFARTFAEERTMSNRSSGRSDQWMVAFAAFTDTTESMIWGHGPGTGKDVYAKFSSETEDVKFMRGKRMMFHSLIMQVMVETGLIGLLPLIAYLAAVLLTTVRSTRQTGFLFPICCYIGYLIVMLTVSGNDTICGTLLGMGLLATLKPMCFAAASEEMAQDKTDA